MDLTVIVTTIPERKQLLGRCLWYLENQTTNDFEVIVAHGKGPKGDKLMRAFPMVDTSHLMMVDDDDWVAPHLVETVLPYTVDFVGYDALQTLAGRFTEIIHQETASHICPIRTDLAREVPFGNEYLADIKWTKQVTDTVESETYIDEVLYFYDKWNPDTDYTHDGGWSPPRQVGFWPHDKMRHRWI